MNADWVHCNKCFRFMSTSTNVAFYLTICKHVFCRICLARNCHMCGAYAKAMKIDSAMHAPIKSFFDDFQTLQMKMQQILNFQTKQMMHLENRLMDSIPRRIKKRKDVKRLDKGFFLLKESVKREKSDYEKIKNQVTFMMRRCDNPAPLRVKSNTSRHSLLNINRHPYCSANTSKFDSDMSFSSGYSNASRSMRGSSHPQQMDSFFGNETYPAHAARSFRGDSTKAERTNHDGSLWGKKRFY